MVHDFKWHGVGTKTKTFRFANPHYFCFLLCNCLMTVTKLWKDIRLLQLDRHILLLLTNSVERFLKVHA